MHESHTPSSTNRKEYLKFIGVLAAITITSLWLISNFTSGGTEAMLRIGMGVFLVVFAAFKFVGYGMFVQMFAGYDIVAKRINFYARIYPFFELGLGVLYLADVWPGARDWLVLLIFGVGSIGVIQEIYHRRSGVYCACLGNIIKLPLSTVSLVEDLAMAAMAALIII